MGLGRRDFVRCCGASSVSDSHAALLGLPRGPAQEAELDLRSRSDMLKGGRSGPAVIPGKPDESPLIQRIRDGACPPKRRLVEANVKPVPDSSLEMLRRWVADGASEEAVPSDVAGTANDPLVKEKDRDFWAFRPPPPTAASMARRRRCEGCSPSRRRLSRRETRRPGTIAQSGGVEAGPASTALLRPPRIFLHTGGDVGVPGGRFAGRL